MLELASLTKRFGSSTAVRDLSLSCGPGAVIGLLGPNGAGKTTTIRMAVGALAPDRGRVTISGFDAARNPIEARRRVGWLPEAAPLYPELHANAFLMNRARLLGIPRKERRSRVGDAIERSGLGASPRRKRIAHLSKGYKQRVGLAAALLGEPEVLILDEPSSGLDPGQNAAFLALLRELAEMRTVMLSTHVLRDVEAVCGRVVIINRGRVLADGEPDRLAQQAGGSREVLLECRGIEPLVLETLSGVDRVTTETLPDGWLSLRVASRSSEDLRGTLMHAITNAGGEVRSLHRDAASLDGVFSQLLASEDGAA